jgi:deazaflavin-dependent oxidoreductase (nitroreductase family)
MNLQQHLRHGLLIVLKYTLNPLTRRLARSSFGPFSLIRHIGRRSGKLYETPIVVAPVKDGFVIELTYGPDVDWHKNVVAAGGCRLVWHGQEYVIDTIEPVDTATGRAAFSPARQLILRLLRRKHFEKLKVQQ